MSMIKNGRKMIKKRREGWGERTRGTNVLQIHNVPILLGNV